MGPDMGRLYDYSQQLLLNAQKLPSLVDAKTTFSNASPEVHVSVDSRPRARIWASACPDIGSALRLMVAGDDEISTLPRRPEQYPVKIRVLEDQRRDVEAVGKLTVPSATRPAGAHRQHRASWYAASARRTLRRLNRQFVIEIQADSGAWARARRGVERHAPPDGDLNLPPGYSFRMSGQTQILDETTANLILAIGLASIFVYMVLAAQFESFVQPIIIMTGAAAVGAVRALHALDRRAAR